ncbi:hypothetical protein NMY22_g2064 [Coprinellus aureogranulatus]|nr:hypothetical protein NMY22_g2064 [Coprinellus aureogranulatus]
MIYTDSALMRDLDNADDCSGWAYRVPGGYSILKSAQSQPEGVGVEAKKGGKHPSLKSQGGRYIGPSLPQPSTVCFDSSTSAPNDRDAHGFQPRCPESKPLKFNPSLFILDDFPWALSASPAAPIGNSPSYGQSREEPGSYSIFSPSRWRLNAHPAPSVPDSFSQLFEAWGPSVRSFQSKCVTVAFSTTQTRQPEKEACSVRTLGFLADGGWMFGCLPPKTSRCLNPKVHIPSIGMQASHPPSLLAIDLAPRFNLPPLQHKRQNMRCHRACVVSNAVTWRPTTSGTTQTRLSVPIVGHVSSTGEYQSAERSFAIRRTILRRYTANPSDHDLRPLIAFWSIQALPLRRGPCFPSVTTTVGENCAWSPVASVEFSLRTVTDDDETAMEKLKVAEKKEKARRRELERAFDSAQLIPTILPGFVNEIRGSSTSVDRFYLEVNRGANDGRSHDVHQIKQIMASWVNGMRAPYSPSPPLIADNRDNRGLRHNVCGRLLTPIDQDWDDENVRAKFRAGAAAEGYVINAFARALYSKFEGNLGNLEEGYLRSLLLVKTYQHIFTSPASARGTDPQASDLENEAPTSSRPRKKAKSRKSVASISSMRGQVTPRSIAYAAVILLFSLSSAPQWSTDEPHEGMDLAEIYYDIVDYFYPPDAVSKRTVSELLSWWNQKIFPGGVHSRAPPKGQTLQDKLAAQRAARSQPLAPRN